MGKSRMESMMKFKVRVTDQKIFDLYVDADYEGQAAAIAQRMVVEGQTAETIMRSTVVDSVVNIPTPTATV